MTSQRTRERLIQRLYEQGVSNTQVLDTIRNIPRHLFLDEALSHHAYEDTALPIGHGQTLSQPYIVARMTEILIGAASQLNKVLEIGTGSGYQTAVLSQWVGELYSVERIKPLQDKARQRLRQLSINNVHLHYADGGFGWPEQGPFDAILSAAAPSCIPKELKHQLGPNGVLVIPVGDEKQVLTLVVRKDSTDEFYQQDIEPVKFVPLLQGMAR
ncbi:protein-L-isoaspartate O-methyltransferase [Candidatus Endobugula sertula]|uniref:Protein-L-isoaspartate O-methyltransferase n=1 Tax=Candidatus Endobugula sertula TaxID=62101 RepID=A0A1D2QM45_9GAMM|nr:protein-L-isoaspartate O-methyltransferase [Candidatus Endobugula sertula]